MAIKLNLLPPEYADLGGLGKVLKTTRALGIIAMAIFFVFALGTSAFFIISTITLKNLNSNIDTLKTQVAAEQSAEQQIVLLKDRISKIKIALAIPDASKNLGLIIPYVSGFSSASSLNELTIDADKVDASLVFTSNADLSAFLNKISLSQDFASVTMNSFSFSNTGGYLVGIEAAKK